MPEKCAKCFKIIDPEKTIIPTRHNGQTFHIECFLCTLCNKPMKGTSFFPDLMRCADCLEQHGPKCFKCKTALQPKLGTYSKVPNEEKYYHTDCLVCSKCNQTLEDGFYERSDLLICVKCKEEEIRNNSKMCFKCEKVITTAFVDHHEKVYHRNCFTCILCDVVLESIYFMQGDKEPLCENCNRTEKLKNAFPCFKCSKPITDTGIRCLDNYYHDACFTCCYCNSIIPKNRQSVASNSTNEPYCELCFTTLFAKICHKCNTHINPVMPGITYDGNSYHKECLTCDVCKNSVDNIAFYKLAEGIVCKNCRQKEE